jgi:hypothetical protein
MAQNVPKLVFSKVTRKDRPICEVRGGASEGTIVYINEGHCCNDCSDKCYKKKTKCCDDCLSGISGGGCTQCGGKMKKEMFEGMEIHDMLRAIDNFRQRETTQVLREFRIHDNGTMVPIPKRTPEHGFIFGATGSGKSVFCTMYAMMYQKLNSKKQSNVVYLITNIAEDPEIDKIPNLIRIPIDDIMNDLVAPGPIHDCMIIFDDVDAIPEKDKFTKVERLRDQMLTTGRHFGISCLVTSHLGANFQRTKVPINESGFVVVFPRGGNWNQIHRILNTYGGLDRQQEDTIRKLPSRWVLVNKTYPPFVVYEKGCYLL